MFEKENQVKVGDVIVTKEKRVPQMIVTDVGFLFCSARDSDGVDHLISIFDLIIIGSI
ncbi:hypothetical protein [Sulfurospirillum multivorans]|uniref:Uncharacterized protein n=2 Tax=Sulfurospirillum multivorans TaxID=66821 RepID=A0AA86AKV8_SULMK|nr:hypothetical protein [Sulfurospirillum multivorans]AHJ12329.1 hypothetical protein SMUL_1063 [Sulfurospirillum multivorans DSM 12446]QEH05829.1 hypothetical protein SMN_1055 [Sulfurospirillum multivorans]